MSETQSVTYTVDVDSIRSAWRRRLRDREAEPSEALVDAVLARAGMIEAAMEDAAMGLIQVLFAELADRRHSHP